jgi:MFS family permease
MQLGAFRSRNYRLYFAAQLISTTGTWIQLVAENWLVERLTGSGLALGVTTALQFTPLLFAGAYGGVVVDRVRKRRLLVWTQSAAGAIALATGLLIVTGAVRVWMVFAAAFALGCVSVFDNPARQAFVSELVERADIPAAVALNNAVGTAARMAGPAIGGVTIAAAGTGVCFLANAGSFVAVVAALGAMRTSELRTGEPVKREPRQIRDGLRYALGDRPLRVVLVMLAVTSTFGFNFQVLLPLLTAKNFGGSGADYGFLMSALGGGALGGSLLATVVPTTRARRVSALSVLFGAALAALAAAPAAGAALPLAALVGATFSLFLVAAAATLQVRAEPARRGRVMSLYTIAFLGAAPVGGPAVGGFAQALGPRAGLLAGACAAVAAGAWGLAATRVDDSVPDEPSRR